MFSSVKFLPSYKLRLLYLLCSHPTYPPDPILLQVKTPCPSLSKALIIQFQAPLFTNRPTLAVDPGTTFSKYSTSSAMSGLLALMFGPHFCQSSSQPSTVLCLILEISIVFSGTSASSSCLIRSGTRLAVFLGRKPRTLSQNFCKKYGFSPLK